MNFKGFRDSGMYCEIIKWVLEPEYLLKAGLHRLVDENNIGDLENGIILCCKYNYPTLLQKLLEKVRRTSVQLVHGITTMITNYPHLEILKVINTHGRRFVWSTWNAEVLRTAAMLSDYQIIKFLIIETKLEQYQIRDAMYIAASKCSLDSFDLLCSASTVNYTDFMFEAAVAGRSDIIKYIFHSNQVVDNQTIRDSIYYSSLSKRFDIAEMISDKYRNTSLHIGASVISVINGKFKLACKLLVRPLYIDRETLYLAAGMVRAGMVAGLFAYVLYKLPK